MKVISLFAGCGGLDLGLIKAGHEIVLATDFDKDCALTYEKNIGNHFLLKDVKKLSSQEFPKYDILTGGFPCQGFSVANLYRSEKDERNELYLEIVRLLNENRPKYFLAENVPGILSLGKGEVVKQIIKEFSEIGINDGFKGYDVTKYLLNSADYGVPQGRKRVIFLGISKDFDLDTRIKMKKCFPPKSTHNLLGTNGLLSYVTLRDTIYDLPNPNSVEASEIPNHYGTKHKVKINGYLGNRKLSWDKISPTIVGRGGGTGGPVIAVHPDCERRFTVRETARIQSFPDSFIFEGSTSSQFRQIGNAVAVEFAYHLGIALNEIEKIEKQKNKKNNLELTNFQ